MSVWKNYVSKNDAGTRNIAIVAEVLASLLKAITRKFAILPRSFNKYSQILFCWSLIILPNPLRALAVYRQLSGKVTQQGGKPQFILITIGTVNTGRKRQ
jgi:hypothetical protein